MGQRVDYEVLQGTRYDQYLPKLQLVLGFLDTPDGKKFKAFRDFMRKNGLWDKEKSPIALSLVDVSWDRKQVTVGPLAQKMAATFSLPELQELLYERLVGENILLVKYVLEALDVDAGGRLHSVHELYRMVTSYVYPGEYITLPNFQAWLDWLAATGYIKLVGIRWALSEKGQRVAHELSQLDVEEILEDLEEESEEESEDDGAGPDDGAEGVRGSSGADMEAQAPEEGLDDGDEDWADMPPEPEPPSEAALAAAAAAFESDFADVGEESDDDPDAPRALSVMEAAAIREAEEKGLEPPVFRPPPKKKKVESATPHVPSPAATFVHAPLPGGFGNVLPPAVVAADTDAEAVADRIVAWWRELGDWPVYTAHDLGVELAAAADDNLLIELGTLATLIEGRQPQPQVFAFVQRMRDNGFFDKVSGGGSFGEALATLGDLGKEPWTRPLIERLVHVPTLVRRVQSNPGILGKVLNAATGRDAVSLLRDELFSDTWVEAPFWTLRELLRLGVIQREELSSCAVVPTGRLLANAARIGLVRTSDLSGFSQLVEASEAVAVLFGPKAGYGEPLEVMDRALSLGA